MTKRIWFYLVSLVISLSLLVTLQVVRTNQTKKLNQLNQVSLQQRLDSLQSYLRQQTDARKLVSLSKQLAKTEPETVKSIVERAYELNPNSRDIAILISAYHPELKSKVTELDPLYSTK